MNDGIRNRACINNACSNTSASRYPHFKRKCKGACIVSVNNAPAYAKSQCMKALQQARLNDDVKILELLLHLVPHAHIDCSSVQVPTIGDDQFKTRHQIIHSIRTSPKNIDNDIHSDDASLGEDMDSVSTEMSEDFYDYDATHSSYSLDDKEIMTFDTTNDKDVLLSAIEEFNTT